MIKRLLVTATLLASGVVLAASPGVQVQAAGGTRLIPSGGTTRFSPSATGDGSIAKMEFRPQDEEAHVAPATPGGHIKFPKKPLNPPDVNSSKVAGSNPEVAVSVLGLNHRDQRLANDGNQFSNEPPDQALCVGGGYVVEAVNSVLQVFDSNGAATLTGVLDLNTFFGYAAAIHRSTGSDDPTIIGPNVIDPVCAYDPDTHRFIVAITTLGYDNNIVNPDGSSGNYNGKNTIDVAVSNTPNPLGDDWTVYHISAQNDGTDGTPNHHCTTNGTRPGPCFQDYPHIGMDHYGVYITTNEYDLFGPSYNAAQIFAMSKTQLAQHPTTLPVTLVENLRLNGTPGFTVWPAQSVAGKYETTNNGTEFLMSTISGDGSETGNPTGTAKQIGLWALTNTKSLNTASPALTLATKVVNSPRYVLPPLSDQKVGSTPLADCINDTTTPTPFGPGCWQLFFDAPGPAHNEVESSPDSLDSRMQQTWYADGIIWGTAGTGVKVGKDIKAGIVWFGVGVKVEKNGKLNGDVKKSGYIGLANNNLTMPAIAMTANGKGAIAFTVMGADYYPSAGYVTIDDKGKVGPIHIAAAGLGPDDGFTGYKAFVGDPPRTRWGDYGAAAVDGNSIWLASEYIAQTCTLDQYLTGAIGSCGGTRSALANWATRITKLNT